MADSEEAVRFRLPLPSVLLDINILLDVLLDRQPGYPSSSRVWTLIESGRAEGYVAAAGITTLYYLARRAKGRQTAESSVRKVIEAFNIVPMTAGIARGALALGINDYEDAVQAVSAEACGAAFIVTRNGRDFPPAPVPAVTPEVYLAHLLAAYQLP